MIELLIVITILGVLMAVVVATIGAQMAKGQDTRRKSDLEKIKVAFEDYYNDNSCYPPADALDTCNSSALAPYMDHVLCDPTTKRRYVYVPLTDNCQGYRLFAQLKDVNDPSIAQVGCDQSCGCGFGVNNNYGVSAGVPLFADGCNVIDP